MALFVIEMNVITEISFVWTAVWVPLGCLFSILDLILFEYSLTDAGLHWLYPHCNALVSPLSLSLSPLIPASDAVSGSPDHNTSLLQHLEISSFPTRPPALTRWMCMQRDELLCMHQTVNPSPAIPVGSTHGHARLDATCRYSAWRSWSVS